MRNILLVDNYDSFTYNLYDCFARLGHRIQIVRNDECNGTEIWFAQKDIIVFSPGPRTPVEAGNLLSIIQQHYTTKPMLGICLGHQALGSFFGARLVHALKPMHGKTSAVYYQCHPIFKDIKLPFEAMRYHSLVLADLPETINVLAYTKESELMCFEHSNYPIIGFQFHPESVLTIAGMQLLNNTLNYLTTFNNS